MELPSTSLRSFVDDRDACRRQHTLKSCFVEMIDVHTPTLVGDELAQSGARWPTAPLVWHNHGNQTIGSNAVQCEPHEIHVRIASPVRDVTVNLREPRLRLRQPSASKIVVTNVRRVANASREATGETADTKGVSDLEGCPAGQSRLRRSFRVDFIADVRAPFPGTRKTRISAPKVDDAVNVWPAIVD